jgi:hypothetical protein
MGGAGFSGLLTLSLADAANLQSTVRPATATRPGGAQVAEPENSNASAAGQTTRRRQHGLWPVSSFSHRPSACAGILGDNNKMELNRGCRPRQRSASPNHKRTNMHASSRRPQLAKRGYVVDDESRVRRYTRSYICCSRLATAAAISRAKPRC